MTEYIAKDQARDALLYLDDDLAFVPEDRIEEISNAWNDEIRRLPAADVVEVVRCKDCADFRPWGGQSKLGDCMVCVCDGENPFTMEETDFCSDGERREGE